MRNLFSVVAAVIMLLFTGAASAQKDLAIVGSSTSACTGPTNINNCYVNRLYAYYNAVPPNDTSIDNSFSVSGYNIFRGMPTGYVPNSSDPLRQPDPGHNITAAIASHPNVILVNYPSNNFDIIPSDSILLCMRIIRNAATQAGIPCFITTTQPRTSGSFSTSAVKKKLAILKDSVLEEFGYFAVDFYTLLINPADSSIRYDAGDGTHMNDIGHDTLFRRVLRKNVFLATLPATFLQFNAAYKNETAIISWITAKEIDVAYYEIQRSSDGANFSKIATVNANNNLGTNQYQYTDQTPLKGWDYYKILIVDKDGKKHASPSMSVFINPGQLAIVKAFAQSSSQVVVQLQNNDPQNAELQIINNLGMIIKKETRKIERGNTTIYINTAGLSNGIYRIRVNGTSGSAVSSFIR